ncbi:hypothetical protein [Paludibacter sp. 221]|uniref:hypothetical protein n=1 Tax=Paludibacter sp. 221 TaxID=2302939 RepID=UPI0013D44892|nr:hypothetical protein [Paludibacter sp. 221]
MKSNIYILLLFFSINIVAQNNPLDKINAEFDAFKRKIDTEQQQYIDEKNREFAEYLRNTWEAFPVSEDTENLNFIDIDAFPVSERIPVTYSTVRESGSVQYRPVSTSLFGDKLIFKIDGKTNLNMKYIAERNIGETWEKLSATDYVTILQTAQEWQNTTGINDWGMVMLFQELSRELFPSKHNEQLMFTVFLLNQIGIDAKLGRIGKPLDNNSHLVILLSFQVPVSFFIGVEIDKRTYYVMEDASSFNISSLHAFSGKIFSYKGNHALAKQGVNLWVKAIPSMKGSVKQKQIPFTSHNPPLKLDLKWNKSLVDFYDTYPQTHLAVYLRAGISNDLKQAFETTFAPLKLNDTQFAGLLLNWFHKDFSYKRDDDLYGHDRCFFAEQSISHHYTDCEDRAVLFAQIMHLITGLDVALIVYDDHVAAGVCFKEKVGGTSVVSKNKVYTICDPTYIGAKVGEPMSAGEVKNVITL